MLQQLVRDYPFPLKPDSFAILENFSSVMAFLIVLFNASSYLLLFGFLEILGKSDWCK